MSENENPKQVQRLLNYMMSHRSVTQLEALRELGIMRLASRISEIRKLGYPVIKTMVQVTNQYGEKCKVAEYRIVEVGDDD